MCRYFHYFSVDYRARCSKMQEHDLLSFCGGCYPSAENRQKRSSWASVAFWSRTSSLQCCKACPAWQLDSAGWSLAGSKFLDWLSSNSCLQKFFVIGGQVLEQPYVLVTAHPCWCLCKSKAKKAAQRLLEFGCQHGLAKPYPADLQNLID